MAKGYTLQSNQVVFIVNGVVVGSRYFQHGCTQTRILIRHSAKQELSKLGVDYFSDNGIGIRYACSFVASQNISSLESTWSCCATLPISRIGI